MGQLLELTARGSLAVILVVGLDRCLAGRINARSRRWWWLLVPAAFLIPFRLPLYPTFFRLPVLETSWMASLSEPAPGIVPALKAHPRLAWASILWSSGALCYASLVTIQTIRASRRWTRERISTDHALLQLLEDCKAEAAVTAPIGVVVSPAVSSPSILGWLRPRILLPTAIAAYPARELRPILLHELAHFRWLDVPFQWFLAVARVVHWFNPFVHVGAVAWTRFREEAADEAAVCWLQDPSGQRYGSALLRLLRDCQSAVPPWGAMAIVETGRDWKRRIAMVYRFPQKSPRALLTAFIVLLTGALVFGGTASSEAVSERDALAEAQHWLGKIDQGDFNGGWADMASRTQATIGLKGWLAAAAKARAPIGRCEGRQPISISIERDPRWPKEALVGLYYEIRFKSSFEHLNYAAEDVMLSKDSAGRWKIYAYTIHP